VALSLVTGPVNEPVTLDEVKAHCRVSSDDDDGLLDGYRVAAREFVESFTGRALLPQTWDLKLDAFPCDALELPMPPVTSVTSITYVDTAGATQTWSSANYRTDLPSGPTSASARITPVYGVSWPSTQDVTNAVTVRFVAGYASDASVPWAIKSALLLLVGHWYAHREAVSVGNVVASMPFAVESLLWPYKVF